MAKAQTRRSYSLKTDLYHRLKAHCDATGRSMSDYVEEVINTRLDREGIPVPVMPDPPQVRPPLPAKPKKSPPPGFTF